MKDYTSYSCSQNIVLGNAGWVDVNETSTIADANVSFDVFIPLKMLFEYCEDYQKIVMNGKHELVLTRSSTDLNAVIQTTATMVNTKILKSISRKSSG